MGVGAIASSYAPAGGGGFVASDYGTVYAEWDFSNTGTITSSSGAVSAVTDLSGNGRTLSQGTGGAQPTTGTRTIGGLNAIDFDGTEWLATANQTVAQPLVVVAVGATDAIGAIGHFVARSNGTASPITVLAAGSWRTHWGTALSGGTADTSPHVLVAVANGASSSVRVDGSAVASGNAGTGGFSAQAVAVGARTSGSEPLNGVIGHVLIYTAVTNLAGLEAALKAKWGTP